MSCLIDQKTIDKTIEFHGHNCPGLSIGIRASELAMSVLKCKKGDNILVLTETDMCAVDAIQFLTGCTFGKGNLVHRDYGKIAFSFFDLQGNRAVRLTVKPGCFGPEREEMRSLMKKSRTEDLSAEDNNRLIQLRKDQIRDIMSRDISEMFNVQEIEQKPPRSARVMDSHECSGCSEMTMESRVRMYDGQYFCIPCFDKVDQKK